MLRQARLDAPGTLHHVMIRGIEGADIFGDGKDREHFLSRVGEITKATGTRPLAWTLIDNHVHLPGSPRRDVSKVGAEMVNFLRRETGVSMAEIVRKLGVGTSAMAIKRENSRGRQ